MLTVSYFRSKVHCSTELEKIEEEIGGTKEKKRKNLEA